MAAFCRYEVTVIGQEQGHNAHVAMIMHHQRDIGQRVILALTRNAEVEYAAHTQGTAVARGLSKVVVALFADDMKYISVFYFKLLWQRVAIANDGMGHISLFYGMRGGAVAAADIRRMCQQLQGKSMLRKVAFAEDNGVERRIGRNQRIVHSAVLLHHFSPFAVTHHRYYYVKSVKTGLERDALIGI